MAFPARPVLTSDATTESQQERPEEVASIEALRPLYCYRRLGNSGGKILGRRLRRILESLLPPTQEIHSSGPGTRLP